jgi:acetyl esterase/lipase
VPTRQTFVKESFMGEGSARKYLDVRLPEAGEGPFPTLLILHPAQPNVAGGVFFGRTLVEPLAKHFSERGYATVAPDWGAVQYPSRQAVFSRAFCALAWLNANAEEYGFDLGRVAVFGATGGGQAAALLGTVDETSEFVEGCPHPAPPPDLVKAIVAYSGVFGTQQNYFSELRGGIPIAFDTHAESVELTSEEKAELRQTLLDTPMESWHDLSGLSANAMELLHCLPPYWVDGGEPPFLILYGELDFAESAGPEAFASQLEAVGVDVELLLLAGANEGNLQVEGSPGFEQACEATEAFLAEVFE